MRSKFCQWPLKSAGERKYKEFRGDETLGVRQCEVAKGPLWAAVGAFFDGVGMGLTSTTFIVSIQSSVDWSMRGAATASHMFMRILGSTVGAAVLGGVGQSMMKKLPKRRAVIS